MRSWMLMTKHRELKLSNITYSCSSGHYPYIWDQKRKSGKGEGGAVRKDDSSMKALFVAAVNSYFGLLGFHCNEQARAVTFVGCGMAKTTKITIQHYIVKAIKSSHVACGRSQGFYSCKYLQQRANFTIKCWPNCILLPETRVVKNSENEIRRTWNFNL